MRSKPFIVFLFTFFCYKNNCLAQQGDNVFKSFIATPQLFQYGNQTLLPIYNLNGGDRFQLEFDDLDANFKSYYYTYQLCDYNWQPVNLSPFDYIKGFTQNRITNYRYSSVSLTRYTHYQAILPERNAVPTKSGNYLLKVFLDGDTANLAFTRRLLVVDVKATINASITQLLGAQNFTTYQKVRFTISTTDINAFSAAQQIKVVILQNNRWDNAQRDIAPTFVRGNVLDYTNDNLAQFAAGKEWRWLDLRSLRLQSDRIAKADYGLTYTSMYMRFDVDRSSQRYQFYPDFDGAFNIMTYETINPFWQGDYAKVHFTFAPPNALPYPNKQLYISGQFTDYKLNDTYKMTFNDSTGMYHGSAFMKQGYYNYTYTLVNENGKPDLTNHLEGNYWETQNNYTILVYYKGFTDRSDQLIGVGLVNSRRDRPGLSF